MKFALRKSRGFTLSELIMVVAIVLVLCVFLGPFMTRTRQKFNRVLCANNLRELGLASFIYAREHKGEFPPTLEALYEEKYVSDMRLVDCPATKSQGTLKDPEYVYAKGMTVSSPSTETLLADKDGNHPQGRNIVKANGDILWEK
ncbi:MAG: type II secretion system protein [Candidatus Omnitrophica bacterium]|jgi:prepilin-type N-terminal cleavage/methylation domain-containing protein|nr:type II secretion system protein [Candidatus Omnitrophota bacterium]MDD4012779.1 type II secretion system protein [Candidatus Omnitrophota bacterium]